MARAGFSEASGSLKGEGACLKVRRRTKSSVQGRRRQCRKERQFFANRMAVISNLPPLRCTTVHSFLPQRA